nr:hypothetical protein [Evansella caseinilytica]
MLKRVHFYYIYTKRSFNHLGYFISDCSKRSLFIFLNNHEAMSHSSLRNCELFHRAIARDGTWIFVEAMLAEVETMSGADACFSSQL